MLTVTISMGRIDKKFKKGKCRIESGIFYPDDTVNPILFEKEKGYYCEKKEPLDNLIAENGKKYWFHFSAIIKKNKEEFTVMAGGGSWEGEGFVALLKDEKLQWILHMDRSEEFMKVEISGDNIIATATYYPHHNILTIPIDDPTQFVFKENYNL